LRRPILLLIASVNQILSSGPTVMLPGTDVVVGVDGLREKATWRDFVAVVAVVAVVALVAVVSIVADTAGEI
jgi:hypothetical protein